MILKRSHTPYSLQQFCKNYPNFQITDIELSNLNGKTFIDFNAEKVSKASPQNCWVFFNMTKRSLLNKMKLLRANILDIEIDKKTNRLFAILVPKSRTDLKSASIIKTELTKNVFKNFLNKSSIELIDVEINKKFKNGEKEIFYSFIGRKVDKKIHQ